MTRLYCTVIVTIRHYRFFLFVKKFFQVIKGVFSAIIHKTPVRSCKYHIQIQCWPVFYIGLAHSSGKSNVFLMFFQHVGCLQPTNAIVMANMISRERNSFFMPFDPFSMFFKLQSCVLLGKKGRAQGAPCKTKKALFRWTRSLICFVVCQEQLLGDSKMLVPNRGVNSCWNRASPCTYSILYFCVKSKGVVCYVSKSSQSPIPWLAHGWKRLSRAFFEAEIKSSLTRMRLL